MSILAALRVHARDDNVAKRRRRVGFTQLQTDPHSIAHLREIAIIVLRLDEQGFQRTRRLNAEGAASESPREHQLHRE